MQKERAISLYVVGSDIEVTLVSSWDLDDEKRVGWVDVVSTFVQYDPVDAEIGGLIRYSCATSSRNRDTSHTTVSQAFVASSLGSVIGTESDIPQAHLAFLVCRICGYSLRSVARGDIGCILGGEADSIDFVITKWMIIFIAMLGWSLLTFGILGAIRAVGIWESSINILCFIVIKIVVD